MPVDPVGVSLASLALFFPIYDACSRLWNGYKLTRSYGHDFKIIQKKINAQWVIFDGLLQTEHKDLAFPPDLSNAEEKQAKAILDAMIVIRDYFEACNTLMEEHAKKERQVQDQNSSQIEKSIVSSTQISQKAVESSSSSAENLQKANPGDRSNQPKLKSVTKAFLAKIRGKKRTVNESGQNLSRNSSSITSNPLQEGIEQLQQDGRDMQQSSRFYRRVFWAQGDRDALLNNIKELRNGNTDLKRLLKLKSPRSPARLLPTPVTGHNIREDVRQIQTAIQGVHEALLLLNTSPSGHNVWNVSLELSVDYKAVRQQMNPQVRYLRLEEDSQLFTVQRHASRIECSDSALLLIETKTNLSDENHTRGNLFDNTSQALSNLEKPRGSSELDPTQRFDEWGFVNSERLLKDAWCCRIFHDTQQDWCVRLSLTTVICQNEFRDQQKFSVSHRSQLARLIICSYLYFGSIRSDCREIRPSEYFFFKTKNEIDHWDPDEPFVLNPYIACGFGCKAPEKFKIGGSSGALRQGNSSTAELGLTLYQIGSCSTVEYGSGVPGFRKAKAKALYSLTDVDHISGPRFTEIVKLCLEFSGSEDEEIELLSRSLAALQQTIDFHDGIV